MKARGRTTTKPKRPKQPNSARIRGSPSASLQEQLDRRTHELAEAKEQLTTTAEILEVIRDSLNDIPGGRFMVVAQHGPREVHQKGDGAVCQIGQLVVIDAIVEKVAAQVPVFYGEPACRTSLSGKPQEWAAPLYVMPSPDGKTLFVEIGTLHETPPNAEAEARFTAVFDVSDPYRPLQLLSIAVGAGDDTRDHALTGDGKLRRVTVLCRAVAAVLLALAFLTLAHAQGSWPDRPIKFIVHVAAGGGVDMNARILVDRLNQQLPHPVLIENQGGGGGVIAGRMVANAAADGYTFLFAGPGHAAQAFMHKQPPFDPIRDFIPVALVTEFPLVVVIKPSLPARTLAEFIALLKAEPDKHTFGSSGVGGSSHIPAEMFVRQAGVSMIHVPFRGNGPSSAALIGGQIDMIIDGLAPQLGNIADGRVRVLGVTTKSRTPFLPNVPAVSETLPGYQFPMWVGLFAPAKTPKPIIDRLAAEVAKVMQDPLTRKRYLELSVEPRGSAPQEFDTFFREQLKFNEEIITSAKLQQD